MNEDSSSLEFSHENPLLLCPDYGTQLLGKSKTCISVLSPKYSNI